MNGILYECCWDWCKVDQQITRADEEFVDVSVCKSVWVLSILYWKNTVTLLCIFTLHWVYHLVSLIFYFVSLLNGNFACFFVVCWFFQNPLFRKILLGIQSKIQTVWIWIRPDILLAWSGFKIFAKTTQGAKELGNSSCFCVFGRLFFKINYFKKSYWNTISVIQFGSRSFWNCLQRSSAYDKSCRHHCVVVLEQDSFILA